MLLANLDKDYNDYVLIKFAAIKVALQNSFIAPLFQKCKVIFTLALLRIVITLFHCITNQIISMSNHLVGENVI